MQHFEKFCYKDGIITIMYGLTLSITIFGIMLLLITKFTKS